MSKKSYIILSLLFPILVVAQSTTSLPFAFRVFCSLAPIVGSSHQNCVVDRAVEVLTITPDFSVLDALTEKIKSLENKIEVLNKNTITQTIATQPETVIKYIAGPKGEMGLQGQKGEKGDVSTPGISSTGNNGTTFSPQAFQNIQQPFWNGGGSFGVPTVISSGSSLPTPSTCLTGEFLSWNGSAFVCSIPAGATTSTSSLLAWSLTGNAGTNSSTNFLGTTDLQDLVFKTNNATTGLISADGTRIAFGIGSQALAGNMNVMGENAGGNATNASFSNFFGYAAGGNATNASFSNFFGYNAGLGATNASNSIFIGRSAGSIDTVNNTATGTSILIGNDTNTGGFSNSIALGQGAVNTSVNQLYIRDAITSFNLAGIPYIFPSAQGSGNTVLTNDGAGNLSWLLAGATSSTPSNIFASNGLTGTSSTIELGGTLSRATTINQNSFDFTSTRIPPANTNSFFTLENRQRNVALNPAFASYNIDHSGSYAEKNYSVPTNIGFSRLALGTSTFRAGLTRGVGEAGTPYFDAYNYIPLADTSTDVHRINNSNYGPAMYYHKYNPVGSTLLRSYAQTRNDGGFYAIGSAPASSTRSDLTLSPNSDILLRSYNFGSTQANYNASFNTGITLSHSSPGFLSSFSVGTTTGIRISDLGTNYTFPRAGVASGTIMGFDDASGQLKFLTPNQIGLIASTTNGLSLATAGAVQLGGTLNATTTIVQGANSLIFERPIFSLANRGLTTWTTASGIPFTTNDFSGVTASTSDVSFVAGANSRLGRPAFEINTARFVGGNANESFLVAFDTAFQAGLSQHVAGVNTNTSSYRSDSNGSHIRSHSISNTRYSNLKLRPNGLNEWFLASTTASTISNSSTGISFNLATGVTFYGGLGAGSQYTFPNMDGVSSTILTTNGAGQLAFNSIPSLIANAGNISIGTSSLLARLHVFEPSTNPVARFENTDGYCEIDPTNTALVCTSDASLKKDVETLPTTLSLFTQLHPVTYRWNAQSTSTTPQYGFIAQEVEALYPTLVFTNSQTNIKTLAYTALIPLTVQAVKELNQSLGDLTNPKVTEETFAGSTIFKKILATFEWLGIKISNGLAEFKTVKTEKLCVGNTCLTEVQVQKILEQIEEQSVQIPSALEVPPVASSTEVAEDPVLAETGSPEPIIEAENITTGPDSEDNTPQI